MSDQDPIIARTMTDRLIEISQARSNKARELLNELETGLTATFKFIAETVIGWGRRDELGLIICGGILSASSAKLTAALSSEGIEGANDLSARSLFEVLRLIASSYDQVLSLEELVDGANEFYRVLYERAAQAKGASMLKSDIEALSLATIDHLAQQSKKGGEIARAWDKIATEIYMSVET